MRIIDRRSGTFFQEKIYGEKFLRFAYGKWGFFLARTVARFPLFSWIMGVWMRLPHTEKKIAPFIKKYGVDEGEFRETQFSSFNEFFIRKLKTEARPVSEASVVAPADGRYLVYPRFSEVEGLLVKGEIFSLNELLGEERLVAKYHEGALVIARLAPPDYHRFHTPVRGVLGEKKQVQGDLFSVNPHALKGRIHHITQNKRLIVPIETTDLGEVLFIPVGATFVGSIHWTKEERVALEKGEELGYFSFGGSMILLFFEKGSITLAPDLVENTKQGFETFIRFGDSLVALQK